MVCKDWQLIITFTHSIQHKLVKVFHLKSSIPKLGEKKNVSGAYAHKVASFPGLRTAVVACSTLLIRYAYFSSFLYNSCNFQYMYLILG